MQASRGGHKETEEKEEEKNADEAAWATMGEGLGRRALER